ncbi:MAG: hypothetical protein H7336_17175, partial [Bacteriovorax sp.]|nr:hypothetical protein [Bacteriovorax sp.]
LLFLLCSFNYAFSQEVASLKFRTLDGKEDISLPSMAKNDLIVLIAYGEGCPIIRKYVPTLNQTAKDYQGKATFLMINAVKSKSNSEIIIDKKNQGIELELYQDSHPSSLQKLGFKTLSEVVLIKKSTQEILYKGAVDNQFTFDLTRPKATEHYLIDALNNSIAGKKVKIKTSRVYGCAITY